MLEALLAAPQWQATAWYLERRFPQHWSRRSSASRGEPASSPSHLQFDRVQDGPFPCAAIFSAFKKSRHDFDAPLICFASLRKKHVVADDATRPAERAPRGYLGCVRRFTAMRR